MRDIEKIKVDDIELEVGVITVKEGKKFQTLTKKIDNLKSLPEDEQGDLILKEIFMFLCKVNDIKCSDEEYENLSYIPLAKVGKLFADKNHLTEE